MQEAANGFNSKTPLIFKNMCLSASIAYGLEHSHTKRAVTQCPEDLIPTRSTTTKKSNFDLCKI